MIDSQIKEITADETLVIRHKVMWPNQPIDFVRIPNDDEGRHFGLFLDEKLISVVSLFITAREAQFRKFATLTDYQGKGYGTLLLSEIMHIAEKENLSRIWCNARLNKTDYYAKFGMEKTHTEFIREGLKYAIMERNFYV